MQVSLAALLLALVAIVYGLYEIFYGHAASRRNGFRFYVIAGYLLGVPFLAVGALLLLTPGRTLGGWEFSILIVWLFAELWKRYQVRKARRENPEQWQRWVQILNRGEVWTRKP